MLILLSRVHENNTLCLVLTFLPYHMAPIFPTMLDILPQNIPPVLKFLQPYIQSRANPPRHAIVYTATHNRAFFVGMSTYTLRASRKGHYHPTLISFWSTVTTEAVATMLDQSRSGRREAQKQIQDDIILRVIPVVNEGLSLENVPDLRVGCYMIMTVLASKASLDDLTLTAMMKSTILGWKGTTHAGLICLAVLAQQKQSPTLGRKVFKSIMKVRSLHDDLLMLKKRYKVDNLVLGVLLGILSEIENAPDAKLLGTFRSLIEADLINESLITIATKSILSVAQSFSLQVNPDFDLRGSLGDLILRLADSNVIGPVVQRVIRDFDLDMEQLETRLQRVIRPANIRSGLLSEDVGMRDAIERPITETFEIVLGRIPTQTAYEISFLSHSDSYVFPSLAHAFVLASSSMEDINTFSDLTVLRKPLAMTEPLFLSFFARIWCGSYPTPARSAAIGVVSEYLKHEKLVADVQVLLPYIIYGLADPTAAIRRASADLILILATVYGEFLSPTQHDSIPNILGQDEVYGQGKEAKEVSWMTITEAAKFIQETLVSSLEECMLDASHIFTYLPDYLSASKHVKNPGNSHKEPRASLRSTVFTCLCSHVVNTPLYAVKYRILQILNRLTKVGSVSRTKLLLPLLEKNITQNQTEFEELCKNQNVDPEKLVEQIISVITPTDRDGMHIIQTVIRPESQLISPLFYTAILKHVQSIWPSMKPEMQSPIAKMLLNVAIGGSEARYGEMQQSEAVDTLRSINLPTAILRMFLDELPILSISSEDKPSASKRRRTSHGHTQLPPTSNPSVLPQSLRSITFVLELIEASKPEKHPELLKGLFQLMADIQHFKHSTGTELSYLQVLTLRNSLAVLGNVKGLHNNRSVIRADLLIDCIRSTTNPQVQHAALLLVSSLASVAPDMILHSVMPVFTYMGANVLRQNDEYSAFVVKQIMESVIPRLVQSLHKQKDGPLVGVSKLLLSFVAAYEHIPAQRRLGLFSSLTEKLGTNDFLFVLLVLLKDKYPSNKKVPEFAVELAGHCGVKTQFLTVEKYLDVALDILKPKPTSSSYLVTLDQGHTPESVVHNLLPLPLMILSAERLISRTARILGEEKQEADTIRTIYGHLLEQIFVLSEKTKHNKKLTILCGNLLHALLGIFSVPEFIWTLPNLLSHTENEIRRQALKFFERRLNENRFNQKFPQDAILAFLPRLALLMKESSDLPLKLTAMTCIDRIIESFGKKDVTMVTTIATEIAGPACLGAEDSSLRVVALLCLATTVEILGDVFVPIIPQTFSKATDYLAVSIRLNMEDERLHNAAYSFMSNLFLSLPWMVTGPSLDRFLTLSHESANAEMGENCDQNRVGALELLAKQIDPKEVFVALDRTWTSAMTEGPIAVKEHLLILRLSISHQPGSSIVKLSSTLTGLFLKVFDLRYIQFSPRTEESYEDNEVEEVEDAATESAIAMIYKMNDTTFRPLYLRILEWATALPDKRKGVQRRITWWTFLEKNFGMLKAGF